ncbi:gliding motility-associated C-terminal domain-containing protein [Flavicella sp.]|uniref:gliding motility-associated C-terminal domain-containing protein n=1 Tax=Flavicella sp. TaxID=2957742 RepID=UPI003019DCC9
MQIQIHTTILVALLFFSSSVLSSQIVNLGDIYISENETVSFMESFNNGSEGELYNDGLLYIYNDFTNDGVVDFLSDTGVTNFIGTAFQEITGSEDSYFYNISFNNGSSSNPFQVANTISVSGEINFEMGIVDLLGSDVDFYFEENATHINGSNESHINGAVHKMGDSDFDFPIGDKGYYRSSRIQSLIGNNTELISAYFFEDSSSLYPLQSDSGIIEEIDTAEYWTVDNITSGEEVLLTLYISEETTSSGILEGALHTDISIVRWDSGENIWINEEGTYDPVTGSVSTLIDNYGIFTFARVEDSEDCLVIYNEFSPNGDGIGDTFTIGCIDSYPNNTVEIYNRWGEKVFKATGYQNDWDGTNTEGASIGGSEELPVGVYYYVINLGDGSKPKAGWLYLNR